MAAKPKPNKSKVIAQAPAKIASPGTAMKPRVVASVAPAIAAVGAKPVPVTDPKAAAASANTNAPSGIAALKKKDLIDKVVEITGAKKTVARDIIEATLTVLGDALSKGAMLNLPPFGKAKVSRPSDAGSGKPMTVKLRRGPAPGQGGASRNGAKPTQSLADAED